VKFGGVKPHICRFSEKFLSDRFAAAFADLKCDFTAFFPPPGSRFKQMKSAHCAADLVGSKKFTAQFTSRFPVKQKILLYPFCSPTAY
jgi:hypothetical protein